jgi:hypothetical protein
METAAVKAKEAKEKLRRSEFLEHEEMVEVLDVLSDYIAKLQAAARMAFYLGQAIDNANNAELTASFHRCYQTLQ